MYYTNSKLACAVILTLMVIYVHCSVGEMICSLPLVQGPCEGLFTRYGYKDGHCVSFIYGGCKGNANNFKTLEECQNACPPPENICSLPLESGPCEALAIVWGYKDGRCEKFGYGGCDGNANRFSTEEECMAACDFCKLPPETGPCRGRFQRYGYKDGECKTFIYGGCEGNANRFRTKSDCERICVTA